MRFISNAFFMGTLVGLCILAPIGVFIGTWWTLGPTTFWERVGALVVCGLLSLISLIPFIGILFFLNEWFEDALLRRRKP